MGANAGSKTIHAIHTLMSDYFMQNDTLDTSEIWESHKTVKRGVFINNCPGLDGFPILYYKM